MDKYNFTIREMDIASNFYVKDLNENEDYFILDELVRLKRLNTCEVLEDFMKSQEADLNLNNLLNEEKSQMPNKDIAN